jgi:hypothetical protein
MSYGNGPTTTGQILSKIPRVNWDEWIKWFPWYQGQHVAIIAETGGGKSTLTYHLVQKRDYVCILCTKPADDTYDLYLDHGIKRIKSWPPPKPFGATRLGQMVGVRSGAERYLLWPNIKKVSDLDPKRLGPVFQKALESMFVDRNWTAVLADLYYLAIKLKLAWLIAAIQFQVRALGVSEVNEMQRPRWVPRETWGQSSHAFLQMLTDLDDLSEMRGLFRMTNRELIIATGALAPYEWLYRNKADPYSTPMIVKPPKIGV